MKLEFLGAAHEVTGSCHYVQMGDIHLLVDCGMEQGPEVRPDRESGRCRIMLWQQRQPEIPV